MGNLADTFADRTADPEFLQSIVDKVGEGFRLLRAEPPTVKVERTCVLSDCDNDDDCTTHGHEAPTITLREASAPYDWRFWPEPEYGCWLAEFRSDLDSPDQWTAVFRSSEYAEAPALSIDDDFVAMWIVALTGPEV